MLRWTMKLTRFPLQTIFQDESGLGAWNRRWCSVQDNKIYYWLYPEDEVNQNKVIVHKWVFSLEHSGL